MSDRRTLALLLCVQAVLLFSVLDLLPVWGDELFTVQTVAKPVPQIIETVRADVHPPLYYLLAHAWPWRSGEGLRALSGLWALAATAILWIFWRDPAVALFALSPCLLLYGRMARSYTMQTALALLAIALLDRWMREPRRIPWGAWLAVVALLYTHYVPGIAILAAFVLVGWRSVGAVRALAFGSAAGIAYLPWAVLSLDAVRRWGTQTSFSATYMLSGNALLEQILKLGFGTVSLSIGESFFAVSLLLVPVVLWSVVRGIRSIPFALVGGAAVIGYLAVARWVSYPFIPARLLWLLPFVCVAAGRRRVVVGILLVSYVTSIGLYFRRENFLNLGYVAPLREIVATLNREAQPDDLILLDPYNTDFQPILAQLSGRTPSIVIEHSGALPPAATVWIVRNTSDVSPGGSTTAIESEACAGRVRHDTLLDPYAPWQQALLKRLGRPMTHFYQLTTCK